MPHMKRTGSLLNARRLVCIMLPCLLYATAFSEEKASIHPSPSDAAGPRAPLQIPQPAGDWEDAALIVGDEGWHNDFCLIQDDRKRWHCIGIGGPEGRNDTLFHAVGRRLTGPYEYLDKIGGDFEPRARHMWAPFAVRKDADTAYLYYSHMVRPVSDFNPNASDGDLMGWCDQFAIRLLVADPADLHTWTPYRGDALHSDNIVFKEKCSRDPCIFWDKQVKAYLMYYAAVAPAPGGQHKGHEGVVRLRTSKDLIHWSKPRTVLGCPPGYVHAESPFCLYRDGYYYLWVSGYDYSEMSLYVSTDPFHFGDAARNRIAKQAGHAVEIVRENQEDYIASVRKEVRIQKLVWRPATKHESVKVVRANGKLQRTEEVPVEPSRAD